MRFIGLFIFLLLTFNSFSQEINPIIKGRLELQNKSRFLLGFDNNYSLVNDEPVRVMGLRFGLHYGKIRLYQGLYFLQNEIVKSNNSIFNPADTSIQKTSFSYISTTVEYVFYENKRWEFSVPAKLGIGTGIKSTFLGDSLIDQKRPEFFPTELSVLGLYKITPWAGISAGLGYRISLFNTNEFDGSFYSFGAKIFLGKLYRTIRPNKD